MFSSCTDNHRLQLRKNVVATPGSSQYISNLKCNFFNSNCNMCIYTLCPSLLQIFTNGFRGVALTKISPNLPQNRIEGLTDGRVKNIKPSAIPCVRYEYAYETRISYRQILKAETLGCYIFLALAYMYLIEYSVSALY